MRPHNNPRFVFIYKLQASQKRTKDLGSESVGDRWESWSTAQAKRKQKWGIVGGGFEARRVPGNWNLNPNGKHPEAVNRCPRLA